MKNYKLIFLILMVSNLSHANSNVNSEMSHLVGGIAVAGAITYGVDKFYPEYKENRAQIGFWVSTLGMVIESAIEYKLHGEGQNQALDATAHAIGSAIGAYTTEQYLIMPRVQKTDKETIVGLQLKSSF